MKNIKINVLPFALKLLVLYVFVFFLTFFIFFSMPRSDEYEDIKITSEIIWPKEGATLLNEQEFVFCVEGMEEMEETKNLNVYWRVDRGIRIGELKESDDGCFRDLIDIGFWDWNKDGRYVIDFFVLENDEEKLVELTVYVYANIGGMHAVNLFDIEEVDDKKDDLFKENLSASPPSFVERVSEIQSVDIQEEAVFSVEVNQANENERYLFNFVLGDGDMDTSSLVAFWQSKGGHKNFITKNKEFNDYRVLIDFSGWRWMGDGPYGIIFSVASEDGTRKLFEEEWQMIRAEDRLVFSVVNSLVSEDLTQKTVFHQEDSDETEEEVSEQGYFFVKPSKLPNLPIYRPEKPAVRSALEKVENSEIEKGLRFIYEQPSSIWLNGDGNDSDEFLKKVAEEVKESGTLPVFILYNIPNRDCGSNSSGGANGVGEYRSWVLRIINSLETTEAIFVIEPDALAQLNCLPEQDRQERIDLIHFATERLSEHPNFHIYIDAGHPLWINPEEMARRLFGAGVLKASGFALNVSNFIATEEVLRYGNYLSYLTGGSRYVIDTSRNGNGQHKNFEWCNPFGRALGELPRVVRGDRYLDAFLWIKYPGESDGQCNGGPSAGHWWTEYAVGLFEESVFSEKN